MTAAPRLMAPILEATPRMGAFLSLEQYDIRVCAAIIRPGDEILVVHESKRGLERVNLPGGAPEVGETLERALIREVFEETGYEVLPTEIAYVAERRAERWSESTLEICFYAEVVAERERPHRPGEIFRVDWISLNDEILLRQVPHAQLFVSSKRGRYVDEASGPASQGARYG